MSPVPAVETAAPESVTETPATESTHEQNGATDVNTAAPAKARRKAAKKATKTPTKPVKASKPAKAPKATKRAAKPAKAKPAVEKVPHKDPKPDGDPLMCGGTRLRCFRALKKFSSGLTAKQIKEKTGMIPVSGHLAVILGEELEKKRIRVEDDEEKGLVYHLTAAGKKAVEDGQVDARKTGTRIGEDWTSARKKAAK